MRKEIGHEEAFQRRTDHWFPGRSRSGIAHQGAMPSARLLRSQLLPMAQQIWRQSVPDAKRLKELEAENGRLKKLLAESLLEMEVTREALRKKW